MQKYKGLKEKYKRQVLRTKKHNFFIIFQNKKLKSNRHLVIYQYVEGERFRIKNNRGSNNRGIDNKIEM